MRRTRLGDSTDDPASVLASAGLSFAAHLACNAASMRSFQSACAKPVAFPAVPRGVPSLRARHGHTHAWLTSVGHAGLGCRVRWTKNKAGATLAATTGFFFTNPPALETTKQLIPDHAHTVAALVSFAVAILAYSVGLRAMRKLP